MPHCKAVLRLCPKPYSSLAGTDANAPPSIAAMSISPLVPVVGHALDLFLRHVDEIDLTKQVRNGLLPAGSRGPKVYIQVP